MDILSKENVINIESRTFNTDWQIAESNFKDKEAAVARIGYLRNNSQGEVYRIVSISKVAYTY
jgi:hypothetical protein